MKYDITKKEYCISKIFYVIENFIHRRQNPWSKGRKNDGFIFVLEGSCEYTFDDGDNFCVRAGDILYLASKSIYKMNINCDMYKFIYCDFLFNESSDRKSGVYKIKNRTEAENAFYRLKSALASESNAKAMEILYRIYDIIITSNKPKYIGGLSRKSVEEAESYIKENISSPDLSVNQLAKMSNMSEAHFRNLFGKYFNITPAKYIINLRIQNAKRLMEHDFFTIEEIALQCGFSTVQYFYRVFKQTTGYTPSEYAKNFI